MSKFVPCGLKAFFPKDGRSLREGIIYWRELVVQLMELSPYFETLELLDDVNDRVLSPIKDLEEYISSWEELQLPSDGDSYICFVSNGFDEAGKATISYNWGEDRHSHNDHLEIHFNRPYPNAVINRDLMRAIYTAIIRWRRPSFIQGGTHRAMSKLGVFSKKISSGWVSWVPEPITHADLPMAHSVEPLEGGSLIFSTPEVFGWTEAEYGEEIRRMQDVEIGLNDLLLLPPYDMEPDWTKPHRDVFR